MKKFIFDINVSAWVRAIQIDAENLDKAKEELYDMSLSDLIENGYVKQMDISDVDYEVEEEDEDEEN